MSPSGFNESAAFLQAPQVDVLNLCEISGQGLVVARARSSSTGNGLTAEHPLEDAFMLSVQMIDYDGKLAVDGRPLQVFRQPAGYITAYDYRRRWEADLISAYDCVNFHLPHEAIRALAEEDGIRNLGSFAIRPAETVNDAIVTGLTHALLPAIARPGVANDLFLTYVTRALCSHVVRTYGDGEVRRAAPHGNLASWQERRAKEMIVANMAGDVKLSDIAAECQLSISHFARSFRRTTGLPPHQWLLLQRVERAKMLLLDTKKSIAEIAVLCGFADQSHLSRVFFRIVGTSPAVWRRRTVR